MQRVAIGRALVRRPKAMLMDEPIGALDAKLREEMRAELRHIHLENDATTVYVTHDQVEAMAMADKIAIMNEGVLQQVGIAGGGLSASRQPVRRAVRRQPDHERGRTERCAPATGTRTWCWARTTRCCAFPTSSIHQVGRAAARRGRAGHRRPSRGRAGRAPGRRTATSRWRRTSSSRWAPTTSWTSSSASSCCARAPPAATWRRQGDVVWARLDEKQTHFFNTRTGESLQIRL